jgi:hypothetical protein
MPALPLLIPNRGARPTKLGFAYWLLILKGGTTRYMSSLTMARWGVGS